MLYPHIPAPPHGSWKELTAQSNLQHLEKQLGCQYPGETSLKVRDMLWWGWECSGAFVLRLTTAVNVKTSPFPAQQQPPPSYSTPKRKCGQVGFPGCPNLLLKQPERSFRDRQILLSNGMLIYPRTWRKKPNNYI